MLNSWRDSWLDTLRAHYPEYLIEGWALGMFMVSAGVVTTLIEAPTPLRSVLTEPDLRRALIAAAMGLTAVALIHSPWGKRSGAHMNPAVTLTFLRLGHIASRDAFFYILAQCVGGTLGVLLVHALLSDAFSQPPVSFVATVPGAHGVAVAALGEFAISFAMMAMILRVSNSRRYMRFTGGFAGLLVALWITFEAPLSGMSMNPARTLASAVPSGIWTGFWIYLLAPLAGMQAAASVHLALRGAQSVACSKLMHTDDQRCIHCGLQPAAAMATAASPGGEIRE
jgi:aquaporin Z